MIEGEPVRWQLCFDPHAESRLVRLIPGRFKHVRAYGFVPVQDLWIFYDVTLSGTVLRAARDHSATADRLLSAWSANCSILALEPVRSRRMPSGFWCVTAMKHLIGLKSGALRPDALYRDCLANGAQTFDESESAANAGCPAA